MLQKAYAEGLRALVLYTATQQDTVELARPPAETSTTAGRLRRVNDLLLPLVKGYGSERAWVLLGTESLQTFGGSGFLPGLPGRAVRAGRQDRHALRGHHGDPGDGLLLPQDRPGPGRGDRPPGACRSRSSSRAWATGGASWPRSASCSARRWTTSRRILGTMVGSVMASSDPRRGRRTRNLYKVGQNTTRLLLAAGDLVVGWLLLRQAEVAQAGARRRGDASATGPRLLHRARWPRPGSSPAPCSPGSPPSGRSPRAPTTSLMDLPEDAF